ncbi:hotdog fold thioesterase [Pseudomonas asuensis]|uniref:Esterase n=1 Tax=Pseudomonas asuensis TaxID=1825787 RepID=A0ABQ2H1N5_9PSED|nr:hotdog fold thioesterase [Pseudomonas asuensis]GGM26892.1 putative esterase [Pseudomonas asuensis]
MSIWFTEPDLAALDESLRNTICERVDIRFEAYDDDSLTASMPVDERTHQPFGLLHGGASVVLAETVGSIASLLCIDRSQYSCVGLEVNANHLRAVRSGRVTAVARPIHLGRSTHVWDIRLSDEAGRATCISRLTVAVIPESRISS